MAMRRRWPSAVTVAGNHQRARSCGEGRPSCCRGRHYHTLPVGNKVAATTKRGGDGLSVAILPTLNRLHLSVVATSRNDDHGGSLLHRMQHFVDGLVEQARRHHLSVELILVEWNPPAERPPLAEALRWPAPDRHCEIRIVTVPPEVHARLEHGAALPLFQMIAKNVGIRRARGRYVLATNIDILFSDSLMRFLRDELRPGRLYRADRCDVPTDVPRGVPFDEVLAFCHRQMFRINTIGRTLIKSGNRWRDSRPSRASRLRSGARRLRGRVGRVLSWLRRGLRFVVARVEASARAVAVQIVGMASRAARWPYQ